MIWMAISQQYHVCKISRALFTVLCSFFYKKYYFITPSHMINGSMTTKTNKKCHILYNLPYLFLCFGNLQTCTLAYIYKCPIWCLVDHKELPFLLFRLPIHIKSSHEHICHVYMSMFVHICIHACICMYKPTIHHNTYTHL